LRGFQFRPNDNGQKQGVPALLRELPAFDVGFSAGGTEAQPRELKVDGVRWFLRLGFALRPQFRSDVLTQNEPDDRDHYNDSANGWLGSIIHYEDANRQAGQAHCRSDGPQRPPPRIHFRCETTHFGPFGGSRGDAQRQ
jgi:hypothetical protein